MIPSRASRALRLAAVLVIASIFALANKPMATAQTLTTLYNFTGGADGRGDTGLVMDPQGNLYGTTQVGGIAGCEGNQGCGTVFKVTPQGQWSALYNFTGGDDGGNSIAPLLLDSQGNLYGTTYWSITGGGAVFKITQDGQVTVLHHFTVENSDGRQPAAALVMDAQGNLYGTTSTGGNTVQCGEPGLIGCGTVFKVTAAGQESIVYRFPNKSHGSFPLSPLILDSKGRLYGSTADGAQLLYCEHNRGGGIGCGTVFRITQAGGEKIFYRFHNSDGAHPTGALVIDQAGNIYGTTKGLGGNFGNVFKVTPAGVETVLNTFTGGVDGGTPLAGLVTDAQGNLYGTTNLGGAYGRGTIFKVTPSGTETVLYSFSAQGTGGADPFRSGVILDSQGNLYGTTNEGGLYGYGTVYKLTP